MCGVDRILAHRNLAATGQPRAAVPTCVWLLRLQTFLQAPLAAVGAVLRGADEHFHEVVVQSVIELALEAPFELRVVEVAGVEIEIVGVHGDGFVFELDDDLDAVALGARGNIQEGMLVEPELGEAAAEAGVGGFGHLVIVEQVWIGTLRQRAKAFNRKGRKGYAKGRTEIPRWRAVVQLKGILRLRCYFVSRTNNSAQDDISYKGSVMRSRNLLVAEGFDRVEAGGFDGREHAADDADET
jgi:hypothetical protein